MRKCYIVDVLNTPLVKGQNQYYCCLLKWRYQYFQLHVALTLYVIYVLRKIYNESMHCLKSVRIRSYSGPYFPAFGLNTERYSVSLRTQSECGKIWTRITPNADTFYAVMRTRWTYNFPTNCVRVRYVRKN